RYVCQADLPGNAIVGVVKVPRIIRRDAEADDVSDAAWIETITVSIAVKYRLSQRAGATVEGVGDCAGTANGNSGGEFRCLDQPALGVGARGGGGVEVVGIVRRRQWITENVPDIRAGKLKSRIAVIARVVCIER